MKKENRNPFYHSNTYDNVLYHMYCEGMVEPKLEPRLSRQTVIAASKVLEWLGHSGFDRMLLEFGISDLDAGRQVGGLMARATALAKFAVEHPEERTAEGQLIGSAVVDRAIDLIQQTGREQEPAVIAFRAAGARDGLSMGDQGEENGEVANVQEGASMGMGTKSQQKLVETYFDPFFNWEDDQQLRHWLRSQDPDELEQFLDFFNFSSNRNRETLGRQELRRLRQGTLTEVVDQALPADRIFIVHGRDDGPREAVARFIERLGFHPIILHERANRGRTIIEKIEAYKDVAFAVVLLTPDDVGGISPEALQPRARQNVLLELGYFMAHLGRGRICALMKGDLELPTDFAGVVWERFDEAGGWKLSLARELSEAGFNVDWGKVRV